MPFNPLGLQPTIRDGISGEGLVTRSAAGPDSSGIGEKKGFTGGYRRFTVTTPMIVRVCGHPPFHVSPQRLASREKYAVVGMRLPLVVSRDLRRIRIECRFTKRVPRKALVLPGSDIPVDVDEDGVRIPWDQIGSVDNFVSSLASLAQPPRHASPVVSVAPVQPAEDHGASDPLDDLNRLGSLRDAGILTEAEFAAEKARVLDRI